MFIFIHFLDLNKLITLSSGNSKLGTLNLKLETLFSCTKCRRYSRGECSGLAPTPFSFVLVRIRRFYWATFLSNNDPICLNEFTVVWIIFLLGNVIP